MARPDPIEALMVREAVRDLVARYTWAGDRGRSDELAGLFFADGLLDVGDQDDDGGRWQGRDEIGRRLDAVAERVALAGGRPGPVRHHVSSLVIDVVSATEARTSSYFLVLTGIGVDHWGRYRDQVAVDPDDGVWRFVARQVGVDGHTPGSLLVRDPGAR